MDTAAEQHGVAGPDSAVGFGRLLGRDEPLVILPGLSVQSVMGAADAIEEAYAQLLSAAKTVAVEEGVDPIQ